MIQFTEVVVRHSNWVQATNIVLEGYPILQMVQVILAKLIILTLLLWQLSFR